MKRDCPKKDNVNGGGKKEDKVPRRSPKVKKFWCALHKEAPGRRCSSESCPDLRRVAAKERLKMLQENGDCFHCVGDHKPDDCQRKHRVCGGQKDDRG